jgi:phosphoglycerol transferase MdoB-like AlkP superfamily enzyme
MIKRVAAVVAAVCTTACAAACAGPERTRSAAARDFTLQGQAPRFLIASQEIVVPLVVINQGGVSWTPSAFHLSYHWLWFIPRELAHRSRWNVPYHDGIRTDLPSAVAPAGRVRVDGRLLAPAYPGLYWLQWDMVEEGVTWFSQEAQRQPRRLVVVVPSLASLFAPLPLVVALSALVLLVAIGRDRRVSPRIVGLVSIADVVWCAATLCSKQLLLIPEALLEPTAVAYWLIAAMAVLLPLIALVVLPRRVRRWTLFALGVTASALILSDIFYYRFFGDVMSAPAVLAARQTGRVLGSIRSLTTSGLLWLVIDLPVALVLILRLEADDSVWRPSARDKRIALGVAAALFIAAAMWLSVPRVLAGSRLDQVFRNRALVEQLGPFGYHAYDIWSYARTTMMRPRASDREVDEARRWFAERAGLRSGEGPFFGAARGLNVIVVQVESLQDFVVDHRVGGQDVMPNLRAWTRDAIRFTNVTDQTSEGRTSDAELTSLVSLLPLDHGAAAFRFSGNHYVGFPRVLSDHGYATVSAVPFEPGFWNRRVTHPSYGFQQTFYESDFELTEQIGWGLNDRDFLQQMVPRLEHLPQPFCAWLITLSLHHPFEDFPDRHKTLKLGALDRTPFGNYLHTMHFFDEALESFKAALARDGLLDRTMIVVFGDHDAGFARDSTLAKTMGIASDEASWTLNDRVPMFIRVPGQPSGLAHEIARPAGQTDFAPTLLALLGIDPAPLPYAGRNLLGHPDDAPIVRPYGDWLDSSHLFMRRSGAPACFELLAHAFVDPVRCADADARATRARDVSRFVIVEDLQQRLR